jgi:hypothetical protein
MTLTVGKIGLSRKTRMSSKPVSLRLLFRLVAAAIVLLIGTCVALGLAELLGGLGDPQGGVVLRYVALAFGGLFVVDLISLVLVLAVNAAADSEEPPDTG